MVGFIFMYVIVYYHFLSLFKIIKDILKIMTHYLLGLCFLHKNGRIHRDIKPQNWMCREGVWKLGDLGLV